MKRFIALLIALCILSVNAAFLISCGDNLPTEEPPNNNDQTENTPSDKTEPTITIPEYNQEIFDKEALIKIIRTRSPQYDKERDGHYNLISAVHKSIRGSDVDAAMYWVTRMLESGEDPKYLLRRLTRIAIEDVSLADPNAVTQAIACCEVYDRLGTPEGDLALMQLTAYLATAPKSAAVYKSFYSVKDFVRRIMTTIAVIIILV